MGSRAGARSRDWVGESVGAGSQATVGKSVSSGESVGGRGSVRSSIESQSVQEVSRKGWEVIRRRESVG